MPTSRQWIILNVALVLVILILALNFVNVELPTIGKAQYALNNNDHKCVVNWDNEFTQWNDIDRCCFESRKQLSCDRQSLELEDGTQLDWVCKTGSGRVVEYWMNNKAHQYCKLQRYW